VPGRTGADAPLRASAQGGHADPDDLLDFTNLESGDHVTEMLAALEYGFRQWVGRVNRGWHETVGASARRGHRDIDWTHEAQMTPTTIEPSYSAPNDAHRIRDLLTRAGLTQQAAALELGVDVAVVQQWYLGRPKPPRMALLALERLIDMHRSVTTGKP
jgi:DNA-binding transcriptional regulator YiaG